MAEIRCPHCGKDNPDFLDTCQFCQNPLRPESSLQIGESPKKINTGELEPILPDWLKDVRKQSRESAEESELSSSATQPRGSKTEAPDLLAGLASQSQEDDDEIPDWLSSINPVVKSKPAESAAQEPVNDFFAQFNQSKPTPEKQSEPPRAEPSNRMGGTAPSKPDQPAQKDELSEWFTNAAQEPNEPFAFPPEPTQDVSNWMGESRAPAPASQPAPVEKEDLSWLHALEDSAKQGEPSSQPKQESDWNFGAPSTPSSSREDLSWLNALGNPPAAEQPAPSQPAQGEDLSWLNTLGGEPAPAKPSQQEDLGWLDTLGGTSAPVQPGAAQSSQQDDLGWLNALGGVSEPAQPETVKPAQQDDLSWLKDLGRTTETPQPASSMPSKGEDLSWLDSLGDTSAPVQPVESQPSSPEDLSWLNNLGAPSEPVQPSASQPVSSEDMSWLNNLGGTPEPSQPASSQEDLGWLNALGGTAEPAQPTPAPTSSEDLSWLNALGEPAVSSQPEPTSTPASSQDDLGWLKDLGETSEPAGEASTGQELSWLDSLGSTPEPVQPEAAIPSASTSDLDWLNTLNETSAPEKPEPAPSTTSDELDWLKNFAASTSEPAQPVSSEPVELGWLDNLSTPSESATPPEPAAARETPDWLSGLDQSSLPGYISAKPFGTTEELNPPKEAEEEPHVSPFVARKTAPLGDALNDDMPDWLRSAAEEQPDLPLGAGALDQFRESPRTPLDETPLPSTPEPDTIGSNLFPPSSGTISNQDVDSLFSMDMPDWLTKPQPEAGDVPSKNAEAQVRDELAPVELPSWVQAMRPVESVLNEAGPSTESQPTEKEGPLAGLRGVIPSAPIGSSRRPKAVSLKLQASDEQQAGAALFDLILNGETTSRALPSTSSITSQNWLRWTIAGILVIVLSAVLVMRSRFMPVSTDLPPDVSTAASAIDAIPNNSTILVVLDYDPSLAGEMEAVGAPVLNQIIHDHQTRLALLATSPESVGLVERLLSSALITAKDGFNYTQGDQYFNLGYLPGGSAGIQGFVTQPQQVIPTITTIQDFRGFPDFSAVILLTDHAESGRAWLEQLDVAGQTNPVILVTSAQAGPLLQPYVASKQAAGMVNGLADAVRYEELKNIPPKMAHTYWDAFGIGILLAILLIFFGSVWSLMSGLRARRATGEQG